MPAQSNRYHVGWRYESGYGGPWAGGEVVELDEATAAAINRDSPGVLERVAKDVPTGVGDRRARGGGTRVPKVKGEGDET